MGLITRLKTWAVEYLIPADLNAEFDQLVNTINALGNANWSAAGVDDLDGQKVNVETNATFLAEHSTAGGHDAFANCNVDNGRVYRNVAAPDSKVDIVFDRITLFSSDTITTRLRKLVQDTGATTLVADIDAANGVNALDTGSVAASTTYYAWVIDKSTADAEASLLSLADTIAGLTLPTDYDRALLVGSVDTDSDSDFLTPKPIPGVGTAEDDLDFAGDDGYYRFGNGLIVQWGTYTDIDSGGTKTITFELEFPHACFAAFQSQDSTSNYVNSVEDVTTTGLKIKRHSDASDNVNGYWFAIGH